MNIKQLTRCGAIRIAEVLAASVLQFVIPVVLASAQTNHAQHHAFYQNWVNKNDRGCCNNLDCGVLAAENEPETADGATEVKIDGQWCPVLPQHYLKRGNAPDWSTSHVCVTKAYSGPTVCDRLLCYQPKPGS